MINRLLSIVILLFFCSTFSMEQRRVIDQKDNRVTEEQKNKLIEKYSSSTWQQDFQYANAVIVALTFPGENYYKDIMDRQWREKYNELLEHGLDQETIKNIQDEFFRHKCKVTKRVGNCYIGLIATPSLIVLARWFGLF